jgi:hypothetical protein
VDARVSLRHLPPASDKPFLVSRFGQADGRYGELRLILRTDTYHFTTDIRRGDVSIVRVLPRARILPTLISQFSRTINNKLSNRIANSPYVVHDATKVMFKYDWPVVSEPSSSEPVSIQ